MEMLYEALNDYDFKDVEAIIASNVKDEIDIDDYSVVEKRDNLYYLGKGLKVFFSLKKDSDICGTATFDLDYKYVDCVDESYSLGYQGRVVCNEIKYEKIEIKDLEFLNIEMEA